MNEKKGFFAKVEKFVAGKGFYMVLLLCLVLLGASGFYLYRSVTEIGEEEAAALTGGPAEITVAVEETDTEPVMETEEAEEVLEPVQEAEPVMEEPEAEEVLEPVQETEAEPVMEEAEAAPVAEEPEAAETAAPTGDSVETMAAPADDGMNWPVNGDVVSAFSASELVYNPAMGDWRTHDGIDINAGLGAEVLAAADGVVASIENDPVIGTTVTLDHGDGLATVYGNLDPDTLSVAEGDAVTTGSVLACVGSSASGEDNATSFLHFEVQQDGVNVDPMDYLE